MICPELCIEYGLSSEKARQRAGEIVRQRILVRRWIGLG